MTITPIITYVMKATINSPPYTKVTWKVYNAADMTGAQSGYDPSTLIDIVVDYTIINKAAVEQATPVVFQPGGVAGGDLSGTYPDPTVAKIHGFAVSGITPTNQYVLTWNSTTNQWEPSTATGGPPSGVAGGDLFGSYPNPNVGKINGITLNLTPPTAYSVLMATSATTAGWAYLDNNTILPGAGIAYSKLNLTGGIVNADVNASAAIAGSKINPNFGSQALTAGQVTLGSTSSINSLIGSVAFNSRTISTSDTIDVFQKDFEILVDTSGGVVSLTLPTPTNGRFLIIKDKKQTFATNNLTLVRSGSEKIDGVAASLVLDVNNKELIITSDGTDWYTNNTSATPTGPAGGDLSGTYPNPQIAAGVIVNADVNASAGIVYSKLNLTGGIVNADVNAAAAISGTKIDPNFGSQNVSTTGNISTTTGTITTTSGNISTNSGTINTSSGNLSVGGKSFLEGGLYVKERTITSSDSLSVSETIIFVDTTGGAISLQLPNPQGGGVWIVKDSKSNFAVDNLTLVRFGSEKIDNVAADKICDINNQEIILISDGIDWFTQGSSSVITWANDLSTSTNTSQNVISLTGSSSVVSMKARDLTWLGATANPFIGQSSTSGTGTLFLIKAQDSTGGDGGALKLQAGDANGTSTGGAVTIISGANSSGAQAASITVWGGTGASTKGYIDITSGNQTLTVKDAVGFTLNTLSTGIVHSSSAGLLSSSLIVDADVNAAAAIAGTKISPNFGSQNVSTTGTLSSGALTATSIRDTAFSSAGVVHNDSSGNFTSSNIVNADVDAAAAIAYSKLNLSNSIVNADVNASAAIDGTKISPNFGSQTVQTTGSLSAGTSTLGSSTSANSILGSLVFTTKTFSTTGTIDTTTKDLLIYADTTGGAFTLTLPAPTNGRTLIIKDKKQNFATANLTLARNGTEKIDGVAASLVLATNNQEIIITSDGTDWYTNAFSTSPTGSAGGDLSGTYPNPTVAKINGTSVPAAPSADQVLVATSGSAATWQKIVNAQIDSAAAITYSKLNLSNSIVNADINTSADIAVSKLAAGTAAQVLLNNSTPTPTWTTLTGDVTVSSAGVTTVNSISGSTPIAITPAELQWASGTTSPKLDQASTSAASGTTLTVQAQGATGATHNGGDLILAGGTSGSATAGTVVVKTGGSTRLTAGATGVITIANLSTGVVHADSSGNLTSSNIINADVDAAAAIAVSKLAAGTNTYVLTTVAGVPTWTAPASSGVTWANDLAGSSDTNQWVAAISGSGGTAGTVYMGDGANDISFLGVQVTSYAQGKDVNFSGSAGGTQAASVGKQGGAVTITGGTGGAGQGGTNSGGSGGDLNLIGGPGGSTAGGGGVTGSAGNVNITGGSAAGNDAGHVVISGGVHTLTGNHGTITLKTASTTRLTVGASGTLTVAAFGTGLVHSDSSGNLTSSAIVNADVDSAAAIAGSKISPVFGAQAITNSSTVSVGSTTGNNTIVGGMVFTTRSLSGNLTVDTTTNDNIILVDTSSARTITLPAPANGRTFIIKDKTGQAETNNITLARNGTEKIEGVAASRILSTNWGVWRITTDGTDWFFL